MSRRVSWRRVKRNRSYTYEEAARLLGRHKNTVRNWVRSGRLEAVTDGKPHLILGRDLVEFLKGMINERRSKLPIDQLYCFRCREGRVPDGRLADCDVSNRRTGNLAGICPVCGTMMHKQVSLSAIDGLAQLLDVSVREAPPTLIERTRAC